MSSINPKIPYSDYDNKSYGLIVYNIPIANNSKIQQSKTIKGLF